MRISAISLILLWAACSFNLHAHDNYQAGDVNGDGVVDITDVSALIDLLLNPSQCDVQEEDGVITYTVKGVSFKMIRIERAQYEMGLSSEQSPDGYDDELPLHGVGVAEYCIGTTEVTQGLWKAVMGTNPASDFGVGDNYPVYNVSWDDCQEFIAKLNELTGQNFRLPTEAEWEFAASGAKEFTTRTKYSGANADGLLQVAWYEDNSEDKAHPVASLEPNGADLYDMSGNVMEWCQDWYGEYDTDNWRYPTGPETGEEKVVRGGGFLSHARFCRVSARFRYPTTERRQFLGLRLAQ